MVVLLSAREESEGLIVGGGDGQGWRDEEKAHDGQWQRRKQQQTRTSACPGHLKDDDDDVVFVFDVISLCVCYCYYYY